MSRKVVFGWSDGGSACEYYRIRVPLEHLSRTNRIRGLAINSRFQVLKNPLSPRLSAALPDVVIVQRLNRSDPLKLLRMLHDGELGRRPRLVYELDDDLFNVPPHNAAAARFARPETRGVMLTAMSLCDVITVSTEPLADVVRRELWDFGVTEQRIEVIPNALPHVAYRHDDKAPPEPGRVTIGWAGSATHEEDFTECVGPLNKFVRRNPDVHLNIICSKIFPPLYRVPGSQFTYTNWIRSMVDYYKALDAFDIGLIPLRPSTFNQSKSDLKFLEYAARRIPVIASPCGPYEPHVDSGLALGAVGHQWSLRLAESVRWPTPEALRADKAFEYAWSRRVDTVADRWLEVITGD